MATVTASARFDMLNLFNAFPVTEAQVTFGGETEFGNSTASWTFRATSSMQVLTLFGNDFGINDEAERYDGPALRLRYFDRPDGSGERPPEWVITGITINAQGIVSSVMSTSKTDDAAMFARLFAGADTFTLSSAADVVLGFGGSDTIRGNGGADFISGGKGRDHLYGGSSADDFIFDDGDSGKTSTTRDIIYDFAKGSDDLDLRLIDANSRTTIDNRFDFGGTRAGANDVWFARSGSSVIVYGDTNGDAKADFAIELRGVSSLAVGDFIL
jgi:Ca2+-binding RTX toxin-like protein